MSSKSKMGFGDLSEKGLHSVIASYHQALAQHDAGRVNFPCGTTPRKVQQWLRSAEAELAARGES